ncbi:TadE/TadG family type IV pilus assembly protein [Phenylobacterium terrae]|uniref:TadE/TadG family type IV pilus assembly protein n=1 Tax=Phenylobacterium terrae TaxID=2665495 RepID=A0ABW4N0A3_9CAUL
MRKLINFWRDQRGAAIVEMAFIAPIIGGMAAVSFAAWDVASRQQDMRAALEVGAEYYMNGGASDDIAKTTATQAWRNAPDDALVTSERICRCGTTVTICTNMCTGNVPPSVYVRMTASGTSPEAMFTPHQSAERIVRVR